MSQNSVIESLTGGGPERVPLDHGTAVLIAALMRRLRVNQIILTADDLRDVEVVGTWDLRNDRLTLEVPAEFPPGLCGQRGDHPAHVQSTGSLAPFRCSGREADRLPGRAERERAERVQADPGGLY